MNKLLKQTTKKPTKKDLMVAALIEDDIDTIQSGEIAYLADLLRDGFKGYNKYSLMELSKEVYDRFQEG